MKFLIALQFLTILPVSVPKALKKRDFGNSLMYFPLVGLLIGGILSFIALFLSSFSSWVVSIILVTTSVVITGGIHLDGLADTMDGIYGFKPPKERLEIMQDSRVGVMGVIGLVLVLLFKIIIIANTPISILWKSLCLAGAFSRWAQTLACLISTYPKKEGKARFFIEYAGRKEVMSASFFTVILFIILGGVIKGILSFACGLVVIYLFINFVKEKIGGMTGDTIGATNEIAEVFMLLFILRYF